MINLFSDNLVPVTGLRSKQPPFGFINDAEIGGVLRRTDLSVIGTFSFEYAEDSDGDYYAVLPLSLVDDLEDDTDYLIDITIAAGELQEVRRIHERSGVRSIV